jgi:type IV pilus assembly protein PilE
MGLSDMRTRDMRTKVRVLKRDAHGFTLIELMVTVAIIAILSAIVYPSYTRYVRKSHRAEAKAALLDLAGREERRFSTMNSYTTTWSELQYSVGSGSIIGSGYYTVSITLPTPTSFLITATTTGTQVADTECTTFTVDQTGIQDATGTLPSAKCWQ